MRGFREFGGGGLVLQRAARNLQEVVEETGIHIAIVAVPASEAQEVVDRLVESGIRAIINYAPISAQVPSHVTVRNIDPVLALQSITYYLR